jgi:hypothetical protein
VSDVAPVDSRPDTYKHIGVVREMVTTCIIELLHRAANHDRSKLAAPEREMYDVFTPRLAHSTYGSDEYKGFLKEMGFALQHHYETNRHHPEHFSEGIKGMNLIDLVEMICDWAAASKRHDDGDVRRSIDINQERFGYSDELKQILHNTIDDLELA